MPDKNKVDKELADSIWLSYLSTGAIPDVYPYPWYHAKSLRSLVRRLPSAPRCRICYFPFEGLGGVVSRRIFGIQPSRLNPYLCNECEMFAEKFQGGAEVEVTMLFADVRGSTTIAESMSPVKYSQVINRFYNTVTTILFNTNAIVEKLIGDQVTGVYTPGFAGSNHARVAVESAGVILTATCDWVPVGVGIHTGIAYIGSINSEAGVSDIAVLGDTANIGARLASQAREGEVLVSQDTVVAADLDTSKLESRHLALKGRSERVSVWVIRKAGGEK